MSKSTVKFNSEKEGILIVKVASFSFAIISWIATAQGLREYVFDYMWQAYLISFGIQGILFVFNLKLPFYFQQIGKMTPENERIQRKFRFGERKGEKRNSYRWTFMQWLIALFYGAVLLSSSIFSFVYICDSVVYNHQSGYVDDNTILTTSYRHILDETEKYIEEYTKASQIIASNQISELQKLSSQTLNSPNKKTEEDLDFALLQAQKEVEQAQAALEAAQAREETAQKLVDDLYEARFWMVDQYRTAVDDLNTAHDNVRSAMQTLAEKENAYDLAIMAKDAYKPSFYQIINTFLTEILKRPLDMQELNSCIEGLSNAVIEIGENGEVPESYGDIVQKTQNLSIIVENLYRLQSAESGDNCVDALRGHLMEDIETPNPQKSSFESDKADWTQMWIEKLTSLMLLIQELPSYKADQTDLISDYFIDTELLKSYDAVALMDEINELIREKLSDINIVERAVYLLGSSYKFTAWFSLIIALFFDVSSLLAGLFVFCITKNSKKGCLSQDSDLSVLIA